MYNLPLYNTTTKPQHGSETLEAPPSASLIQGRQPIQQKSKRLFFQALLLWTGFTVATLLLLRAIQSSFEFNDSHSPDSSSASATSSDKDPRKVISKEFVRRPEYFDFSPTGDKVWEDIIPLNGGGIPVFKPNDSLHVYGVSMFHQLHCLGMIRGAIQKLQMSQGDVAQLAESGNQVLGRSKEAENEEEMQHHWVHCLDYIMQGILCCADSTIEPPSTSEGDVNGYDTVHQCRNSDALYLKAYEDPRFLSVSEERYVGDTGDCGGE